MLTIASTISTIAELAAAFAGPSSSFRRQRTRRRLVAFEVAASSRNVDDHLGESNNRTRDGTADQRERGMHPPCAAKGKSAVATTNVDDQRAPRRYSGRRRASEHPRSTLHAAPPAASTPRVPPSCGSSGALKHKRRAVVSQGMKRTRLVYRLALSLSCLALCLMLSPLSHAWLSPSCLALSHS